MCYTRFGAYRNRIHTTIIVKKTTFQKRKEKQNKKSQQHRYGLMLGLSNLMPYRWLEVSLHPEGPATGQLDSGFPWFSLVPEQML
jgi:hypothetical protein